MGEKTLDYSLPPKKIKEFLVTVGLCDRRQGRLDAFNQGNDRASLKEKSKPRVEASTEFKKIRDELDKIKKRGKMVVVGDILKDKEKDPKKKKGEDGDDDENASICPAKSARRNIWSAPILLRR